jgi:hypothetical protein
MIKVDLLFKTSELMSYLPGPSTTKGYLILQCYLIAQKSPN